MKSLKTLLIERKDRQEARAHEIEEKDLCDRGACDYMCGLCDRHLERALEEFLESPFTRPDMEYR